MGTGTHIGIFDPVIFIIKGSDFQLKYILYPLNTPGNLTVCEDMFDCHNLMGSATGVNKLLTIQPHHNKELSSPRRQYYLT